MRPQGWRKLVNAALLSLINEACVIVCCATLISSKLVGPACVQALSSNPRSGVCMPNGKGSVDEGILSDVVPIYLHCPTFNVSVSLLLLLLLLLTLTTTTTTTTIVIIIIITAGTWDDMAIQLVQEIGRRTTVITQDTRETVFLFQRLSIALQWGNPVSFLNTINAE